MQAKSSLASPEKKQVKQLIGNVNNLGLTREKTDSAMNIQGKLRHWAFHMEMGQVPRVLTVINV